ncbi:hypothetical protein BDQ17DRAFT_887384 [Cyathus striatus]|nr:hypothetical protein BDQ17DRAFT_887384 [Cyathus striatus]
MPRSTEPYQPISTNSIYIGGYYSWYTYEYRPGELYVGLITSQFDDIRLSMCKSLFILDNIVGFISQYNYAHLHLKLVDILDSSNSKEVILELQNGSFIVDYKSCWVQQGSLYLHLQISSSNHEIYRITFDRSWPTSNSSLDHREIAKMTLVMKDEWKGNNYKYQSVWTPWLKMSTRGLQTAQVLSSSPDRSASPRITRLSYWPLKYNNEHGIYVGNERNYREIPGEITYFDHDESGYLTFRSYSGTYAIMVIASPQRQWDDLKSDLGLYLFHFSADSLGQIPYRKLDVPERINLEEIFSISIEERSGMIYLVDVRGWLFGLQFGDESPYATRSMADSVDGLAALSIDPSSSLSITRRLGVTSGN